jgi:D-alanine--poly(phosphoribitol) ligase subunit 1
LPEDAPYKLPALLREHRITFWLSVPTTGLTLANLGLLKPASLPDLRCTLFCGEPLPQRLAQSWHRAAPNGRLFNIYGPTECTIAVTAFEWHPDLPLADLVPIGEPYPAQDLCIVDDQLREQPPGAVGELCISGTQVVPGYYGDALQTQQRFVSVPGRAGVWYRTGDQVQRHPDWGLLFKGRRDDQMQVRGYRVERLEVEALMRNALSTDAVAVVGWPVVEGNLVQGIVAFVGDQRLSAQDIRRRLRSDLPEYMWPSQVYIQDLPQTRSRKVDYTALRRQLMEAQAAGGALEDVA